MRLIDPSQEWQAAFVDMAQDWQRPYGDSRYRLALTDFEEYLQRLLDRRRDDQPPGEVPVTDLWLEHEGQILGCVRLRFNLTEDWIKEGGHVGYDIRPSARRRGYGTQALKLALPILHERGIRRVRITCDDDNVGSYRIIEKNGGVLDDKAISDRTRKLLRQYWVNL